MPNDVLDANSIIEAHLFALVTPCSVCRHGGREVAAPVAGETGRVRILATCQNCGTTEAFEVRHDGPLPKVDCISWDRPINPGGRASRILDLGQWLTLAELMLVQAERTPDAGERLWLRYRAGECYEEALRFYGDADDLPPESACLTPATRQGLRQDPGRYARSRLVELRAGLPVRSAVFRSQAHGGPRKWWQFWKRARKDGSHA